MDTTVTLGDAIDSGANFLFGGLLPLWQAILWATGLLQWRVRLGLWASDVPHAASVSNRTPRWKT